MPNVDAIQAWIEDLRTTTAPQGKWRLRTAAGDCCLARACEVYRTATGDGEWIDADEDVAGFRVKSGFEAMSLPHAVILWLGLSSSNPSLKTPEGKGSTCQALNDREGYSFSDIADALQRTYLTTVSSS